MSRQIVNIINFIRGCEPRCEVDLYEPVRQQLALLRKHDLPGTFLFQYDALLDDRFVGMLREASDLHIELGVWLEMVQPLTEAAGIPWRGRFPWDWHAHCGFSVGYTKPERERLIDCLFGKFRDIFGAYPRLLGSWNLDSHSLAYISDKYGLDAACFCKDQWGTDGYSVWGGYYGQGYYPSRANFFCPAQTEAMQIPIPTFRMLGSDPIYQYDIGLTEEGASVSQGVVTLEPVYVGATGGGGCPDWVDWYLRENFNGNCLSFGYTQAGQENSFGWPAMSGGLIYQHKRFDELRREGKLEVETLGETGRWYKQTYPATPASAIAALSDWKQESRRSIWYSCRNYRVNLMFEKGRFWLRDLYLFREDYPERYQDEPCRTDYLVFDNLPVMDGNRFSGHGVRAGIYPFAGGEALVSEGLSYRELSEGSAVVSLRTERAGQVNILLSEQRIVVDAERGEVSFAIEADPDCGCLPELHCSEDGASFVHNGFRYRVGVPVGVWDGDALVTESGRLVAELAEK